MKKKKILIILFVFSVVFGKAQENLPKLKVEIAGGFSTYSFENLERLNTEVAENLPFGTAVVDNFPYRIFYGGSVLLRLADWYSAGPAYEFHTTGSRIGARDYSGSYSFDQILTTHQLGLENEIKVSMGIKPAVFLDLTGGVNFSSWKMEEMLDLTEEFQEDKNEFSAIKPFVYPAVKLSFPVYAQLSVLLKAGYLFDVGGKYKNTENRDFQSTQKIPWNGFRVSLGVSWRVE